MSGDPLILLGHALELYDAARTIDRDAREAENCGNTAGDVLADAVSAVLWAMNQPNPRPVKPCVTR